MKKEIALKPLCEYGSCAAYITDNSISLRCGGVNGCLKAWLTGSGTNLPLGNLVNGQLQREADVGAYCGILVTQSGRQMFYGKYAEECENAQEAVPLKEAEETTESKETEEAAKDTPIEDAPVPEAPTECKFLLKNDGFHWRHITDSAYPSDSLSVRYILSHTTVYNSFLAHGGYYYGEKEGAAAIAMECDIKNEPHPMPHMAQFATYIKPYFIVCVNLETKEFYPYA
ncbi:MAG: hypothetical protein Q4C12_04185 [Clostridia bacterium]|nr:hypothetical protein [Clostridia bacterium]